MVILSSSGDILIGSLILSRFYSATAGLLSGLESGVLTILPMKMSSKIDMAETDLDFMGSGVRVGTDNSILIGLSFVNRLSFFDSDLILSSSLNELVNDISIWLNGDDTTVTSNCTQTSAPVESGLKPSLYLLSHNYPGAL